MFEMIMPLNYRLITLLFSHTVLKAKETSDSQDVFSLSQKSYL